jgi:peptidoglycan-N-acetylglucosamine deacetylase
MARRRRAAGGYLRVVRLVVVAGIGLLVGVLRPPALVVRALSRLRGDLVFEVPQTSRRLALSFDDGPDPVLTPALLDTLRLHDARATFFFLGSRAGTARDVVERAIAEGHEIGNHHWRDERTAGMPAPEFESLLLRTEEALAAPLSLFRPGGGWIGREKTAIAARRGYRCALGSIYPYDAQVALRPRIVADVARRARPGAIIVLHEGRPDRRGVVAAVDDLLTRLRAAGYAVVPISEL